VQKLRFYTCRLCGLTLGMEIECLVHLLVEHPAAKEEILRRWFRVREV